MTPPQALFHTLLRPSILQILRATGYHSAKPAVLDSLTDLAARYLSELCHLTALYAAHNGSEPTGPDIVDVRMALQHMGALLPELPQAEQELLSVEDTRGTDEFVAWAAGDVNEEIKRVAQDESATDYLDALIMKHGKTDDGSKFAGTIIGKCNEHGDILVEGGEFPSIQGWAEKMRAASQRTPSAAEERDGENGEDGGDSRPASSGLSSLGDRSIEDLEDMMDYM